jgi:hypothetical protein
MSNDFEQSLQIAQKDIKGDAIQIMTGQYMQEIQGKIFMAKQYPRDINAAWLRVKDACKRETLAKVATYEYPRGKEKVSGPSIRLAEVLSQNYGNMMSGVIELEQKNGESQCMSFAWDLETNVSDVKTFTIKHERKASGEIKKLTDPRDIYEMVANQGARRKRACILAIIPKDFIDAAVDECEKTLAGDNKTPKADIIKKMLEMFVEIDVTKEMIEKYRGYKVDQFTNKDFSKLQGVYNAIKEGSYKREDYFEIKRDVVDPFVQIKIDSEGGRNDSDG